VSADFFGASPVASALDLRPERDSPADRFHLNTLPPHILPKPDISTWQKLGHFYLALTRLGAKVKMLHDYVTP
jgi:hypothetical protein